MLAASAHKFRLRVMWGSLVSCAPIDNRRRLDRTPSGPQDYIAPHIFKAPVCAEQPFHAWGPIPRRLERGN